MPPLRPHTPTCLQSLRKVIIIICKANRAFWGLSLLLLSSLLIILHALPFSHTINLDIPSLCAINRNLHHRGAASIAISRHETNSLNVTRFSILTLVDSAALSTIARPYPSFLESRSLYASLHGYQLRMYFHRPDLHRPLVWSKILAIEEIFYPHIHVQAAADRVEEWIWVLDLDVLIFNFNVKLETIVESASSHGSNEDSSGDGGGIDIIIARDHNGVNAGSFLMRKSEWSKQFLRRWWRKGSEEGVPMMDKLFEQAALSDLLQSDESVAAHVHIAPLRDFNAYGYPSSDGYLFRPGDFLVHCPGPTLKKWLPAYAREWEKMMQQCKLRELWMRAGLQFEQGDAGAAFISSQKRRL